MNKVDDKIVIKSGKEKSKLLKPIYDIFKFTQKNFQILVLDNEEKIYCTIGEDIEVLYTDDNLINTIKKNDYIIKFWLSSYEDRLGVIEEIRYFKLNSDKTEFEEFYKL